MPQDPKGAIRNARARELVGPQRLQTLQTPSDSQALLFFSGHLMATLLSGTGLWLALGTIWAAPVAVIHGVVIVHWFAPLHECAHGTACKSGWLNTSIGWWAGLVIMIVPPYFKYEHVAHHAYTSDTEKDPERIPQGENLFGYFFYASAIPYFQGVVDVLLRAPFGRFNRQELRFLPARHRIGTVRASRMMWLAYTVIAALSIYFGSFAAVTFWLLPRVIGEPFMRLIRMTEHVGCEKVSDMLRNTRTVVTRAPLRLLAWNMCYHAEHHALPQVPFHALPALHRILRDHVAHVSHGYLAAQAELVRNALAARRSA